MHHPNRFERTITGSLAGRFSLGLLTALSLVLVAFEWRSDTKRIMLDMPGLQMEPTWEHSPVVLIEKKEEAATHEPSLKPKDRSSVVVGEPDPITGPDDGTGTSTVGQLTKPPSAPSPRPGRDPLVLDTLPWGGKEVRPYFMDCLKRSPSDLVECTEYRIHQHLTRHFRMPKSIKGEVRTMVTFEIDTEGSIGRMACAPKVSAEVDTEIQRVFRALPHFVPGTQNGIPVPVVHRIPVTLRSH